MARKRARPARTLAVLAVTLAALGLGAARAADPAPEPLKAELDAALEKGRGDTGVPAATGAAMRCGRLLWSGASGVTDLASGRPATPTTRFVIASSTKPVVAALVLALVDRRKLSLKAPLSDFYPRLPNARRITLRMLLDHTSGLNEYFDDPRINRIIAEDPDHRWKRSEVVRGINRARFTPGKHYVYTNSNYVLLGGVLEKAGKASVEKAFRKRIAGPSDLESSTFTYSPKRSALFAHPYVTEKGKLRDAFAPGVGVPADYWGPVWTDGGLASTAPDLARFGDGLFEGSLLRPKTLRAMRKLNRFRVGLGVHPRDEAGRTWLGHDGAYGGYESEVWYDATRGITIAVTTNRDTSSDAVWRRLAAAYDRVAPDRAPC